MMPDYVPADTRPEAARVQLEIIRRMPPHRRLEQALAMSDHVRRLVADGARDRHPDYSDEQVRLAVIRISLGDDLFRRAYPGVDVVP